MAKVKVFDYGGTHRGLNIDNVANTALFPFDGNYADPELEDEEWGIDVSYLIGLFDECTFLSLGAGGGGDVMQALRVGPLEDWGFAVNGTASVLGGTAVLLVAFGAGFAVALSLAAALYLLAGGLLAVRSAW